MKKLFLFALAVASLSACKKDSENTPSKTELLTSRKWQITGTATITTTAITGNNPSTTSTKVDYFPQRRACEKDDVFKFNTDNTMVSDEGPTKCSPSAAQLYTSNWRFNSNQTKLTLLVSPNGLGGDAQDIAELSTSTLRLHVTTTAVLADRTITTVTETIFSSI